ncbi:hypothetical protein [Novipirellula artificiosorum]|uniref:Twin-arginine translocation signal domain-containing protein n=1 Tax=Novipirellula artificiosorum TaxID=2528016 RepID=A0A5C6DH90_9BACT|nr:hypothetical protein [Novipirellula artificiosorum]TWU34319.1 hypothetical protein Poly41_44660 [Novipirellula artificiosorum]
MRPETIDSQPRRQFLRTLSAAGAAVSLQQFGFLRRLPQVSASETQLAPNAVQFSADIEPLVRLLEETPRDRIVSVFAAKIQSGTSYREILTALLLAGVRNVQPRPSVGFKFHAVLVVNSAHLASLAAPDGDRWLPIFWALDYFKSSQAQDEREGDWTLAAVDESRLPPSHRARQAFREAMDAWDVEAADVAVASLCRSASASAVFDLMAHYGCRDYRSIGHKAIYVANAFRTLQCIGWRYSEPVLRSLAYALLNHSGEPNPATSDLAADAAWKVTQAKIDALDEQADGGRVDSAATLSLLDTLRTATPSEAVAATVELLSRGVASQSISDALFLSAAEMLSQQPGIISLHAATTTNAMQFAYRTAHEEPTRRELMLQNAAFIPHFRKSMESRGEVGLARIDATVEETPQQTPLDVDEIFTLVSTNRNQAASAMRYYLNAEGRPERLINAAQRLVFLKGTDSHDYKFSSAALEDYYAVSPPFRNAYLASAAHLLHGSEDRDNGLIAQVRSALE